MKIKDNGNTVKVDDTCYLETLVTRISNDGVTFGEPIVCINEVMLLDGGTKEIPMFLTPKQAIRLGNLLRECGKEAYAQRFDND